MSTAWVIATHANDGTEFALGVAPTQALAQARALAATNRELEAAGFTRVGCEDPYTGDYTEHPVPLATWQLARDYHAAEGLHVLEVEVNIADLLQ